MPMLSLLLAILQFAKWMKLKEREWEEPFVGLREEIQKLMLLDYSESFVWKENFSPLIFHLLFQASCLLP